MDNTWLTWAQGILSLSIAGLVKMLLDLRARLIKVEQQLADAAKEVTKNEDLAKVLLRKVDIIEKMLARIAQKLNIGDKE